MRKMLIALCAAALLAGIATADPLPPATLDFAARLQSAIKVVQDASTASPTGLDGCLRAIPGLRVEQPNSNGWSAALTIWNLRPPVRTPVNVVYPKAVSQVSRAVKCARQFGRKVVPRGGGHSYEGYGNQDGKVIIDLRGMSAVTLSSDKKTASIGAGALLGPIYKALWDQGRKGLPAGTCPAVGIGGHIQGGGQGLTARKYGLASDRLIGVQVVDYTGRVIHANADSNADLLWATKGGGGGNLGIAVKFYVSVSSPPSNVVLMTLTWPYSQLSGAIQWYQTKMPHLSTALSSDLFIGFGSIQLHGLWLGSRASLDSVLASSNLNGIVGTPSASDIRTMPYINAMAELANQAMSMSPDTPASLALGPGVTLSPRGAFKAKSSFITKPNTAAGIGVIASWLSKAQSQNINGWIQFHAFGGALNVPKSTDTAFPWRSTLGNAQFYVGWSNSADAQRSIDWINGFYAAMKPHQSSATYINYIDYDLGSGGLPRYYGGNLKRLVDIKKRYDPTNFFNYPFSIPTKLA